MTSETSVFRMRHWSIGAKLTLATTALIGAVFLAFIAVIGYSSASSSENQALREVSEKTKMLSDTVDIVDQDLRTQVNTFARIFKAEFKQPFSLDTTQSIKVGEKNVPLLMNGTDVINLNFAIPDNYTDMTGVYATVFARIGDDFIRVTTSHKKENGERAIGTLLDRAHPGYKLVLDGKTFSGPATLFGGQYMTRYDPIKDGSGKVIGILYVGVNFSKSMQSLATGIKTMKLGKTGLF